MEKKQKVKDVFENVEYFHIVKGKNTLMQLEGNEINGIKKADLQKKIGDVLGNGTYNYILKFENDPTPKRASIRGFTSKREPINPEDESNKILLRAINDLNEKIDSKNQSTDIKTLLSMQENAFKIQIAFYEMRVKTLEEEKKQLEKMIEENGGGNDGLLEKLVDIGAAILSNKVSG